ncbi:MAG: ABC-F family ATP-binding cassette domain-containing protein [Candidatus Cloacimonetes bacterium]|nr:ABC-F family ATP-binding cassette domain-containing protein [Candidatus Cloacimonadota bacterium]
MVNILSIEKVTKQYGVTKVLDEVNFGLVENQKIALIGANGSGKSTLMKIIMGDESPDSGNIHKNKGFKFAYLSQNPKLTPGNTIFEEVLQDNQKELRLLEKFEKLTLEVSENPTDKLIDQLAKIQDEMESLNVWDLDNKVRQYLHQIGIADHHIKVDSLSGGEIKKVALAKIFLQQADCLFLDEPTNHLDTYSIEWLEQMLIDYKGALLLVTHDRYFLTNVIDTIVNLDRGGLKVYEGNYDKFLESRALEDSVEDRTNKNKSSFLKRELVWINKQPRARGTKAKYRIDQFAEVSDSLSYRPDPLGEFRFGLSRKLGNTILEWNQLGKKFDKWLFKNSVHKVLDGEKIGIIGKNGAGKSTFIKILLDQVKADEGGVIVGQNTHFCYLDQNRAFLDEEDTVLGSMSEFGEFLTFQGKNIHVNSFLDRFNFYPDTHNKKIKLLSGGERARLLLARMMATEGNFLILDEPTNDLDLLTLRLLEEAVLAYEGCAFVISHDRYFLDRVCTSVIEIGEEETPFYTPGNFTIFKLLKQKRDLESAEVSTQEISYQKGQKPKRSVKKFGYKEQNELKDILVQIDSLEAEKQTLDDQVTNLVDYDQYNDLAEQQVKLNSTLESVYERWEELEELKELNS